MSVEIALLRHGATPGNLERRYVGSTDEPLCPGGRAELEALRAAGVYPAAQRVYCSPMLRCVQTAGLLYPGAPLFRAEGLRERAFGAFEYKTHAELEADPAYRAWVDSAGESPIPGGEPQAAFRARCLAAFGALLRAALRDGCGRVAVVAHGGALMTILAEHGAPARPFYGWQAANGRGFLCGVTPRGWERRRAVTLLKTI